MRESYAIYRVVGSSTILVARGFPTRDDAVSWGSENLPFDIRDSAENAHYQNDVGFVQPIYECQYEYDHGSWATDE